MDCRFLAVAYVEFFKLCRVYRESESSCLTYCDFLKYNISLIKNYLLPYSNHLIRYWEPELIRHPYKKLEKVTELLS